MDLKRAREEGAVLVTGGAGFIGSHLCERLVAEGAEVICLDVFSTLYDPARKEANIAALLGSPRFTLVRGDVADERLLESLFSSRRIAQVVHLAAWPGVRASLDDPLGYERVNVRGTLVLLEALRRRPVKSLVFGSSSSVYGATATPPFREDDELGRPLSPYAATKRIAEHFCHVYAHLFGLPAICLRFFTVYGPRNRPDMAAFRFATALLRDEPIALYGDGSARRDFTYVDDTVDGIRAALDWEGSFEVVNLGNSRAVTLLEFLSLLERATGKKARLERQPPQPGDVPLTCADTQRAERVLGFRSRVPLETGLERLVDWARGFLASSPQP